MSAKNVKTLRAAHESWNKRDFAGVVSKAVEELALGKRRLGNIVLLMECLAHPPAVGSPSSEIDQERAPPPM